MYDDLCTIMYHFQQVQQSTETLAIAVELAKNPYAPVPLRDHLRDLRRNIDSWSELFWFTVSARTMKWKKRGKVIGYDVQGLVAAIKSGDKLAEAREWGVLLVKLAEVTGEFRSQLALFDQFASDWNEEGVAFEAFRAAAPFSGDLVQTIDVESEVNAIEMSLETMWKAIDSTWLRHSEITNYVRQMAFGTYPMTTYYKMKTLQSFFQPMENLSLGFRRSPVAVCPWRAWQQDKTAEPLGYSAVQDENHSQKTYVREGVHGRFVRVPMETEVPTTRTPESKIQEKLFSNRARLIFSLASCVSFFFCVLNRLTCFARIMRLATHSDPSSSIALSLPTWPLGVSPIPKLEGIHHAATIRSPFYRLATLTFENYGPFRKQPSRFIDSSHLVHQPSFFAPFSRRTTFRPLCMALVAGSPLFYLFPSLRQDHDIAPHLLQLAHNTVLRVITALDSSCWIC
ncbi:hypothetical protein T439DRAFT_349681 [Meredithblackwellia eburnea MCA 4105]